MTEGEKRDMLTANGFVVKYQGSYVAISYLDLPELTWTGKTFAEALKPLELQFERLRHVVWTVTA